MAAGGSGLTVLSCDNLMDNGGRTGRLVRDFGAALPAAEGADLLPWIEANVTFPGTMVDRIVPATTDAVRALVSEKLGALDAIPVPTEPFSMWVLEDSFAAGRPRWEAGGAIFTSDVGPFEVLKLRLLNGTHSLIACLGLLAGQRFVSEAIRLPFVEEAARRVIAEDFLPTFTPPEGIDVASYVEQLFGRFGNAALGHRTDQVASGGSLKLPQRITEPVLENRRAGRMPDFLALTVAAFLCCVAPLDGRRLPGTEGVSDPASDRLAELAAAAQTPAELVEAVFRSGQVFAAELAADAEFLARTAEFVDILRTRGPAAAVAATR
jgi:fructuronate reductase